MEKPLRMIVQNVVKVALMVVAAVLAGTGNYRYNAANGTYGEMVEMGVLDPAKVTSSALQNAAIYRWPDARCNQKQPATPSSKVALLLQLSACTSH